MAFATRLPVLALAVCSCSPQGLEDSGDDPPAEPVVSMALHPDNPHAATARVWVDVDASIHVVYGEAGTLDLATPAVHGSADQEVEILVLGLRADRSYTLAAVVDTDAGSWTSAPHVVSTPPLPDDWPDCVVDTQAPAGTFGPDEVVCTNIHLPVEHESRFACVDRDGEVVYQLAPRDNAHTYATTPLRDGRFAATAFAAEQVAVCDELGVHQAVYTTLWFDDKTRFVHEWLDGHEVIQLDQGPWAGALAIITNTGDVWHGQVLFGGGIIVLDPDTGEVRWDWSTHGELGDGQPIDGLDYARTGLADRSRNWLHTNALVHGLDEDGGQFFWVSLRRQDWIVKVDVETDEIVWRLGREGDFTLVEDLDDPDSPEVDDSLWFYHQHAPELQGHGGGRYTFLVYDNGNVRVDSRGHPVSPPEYSRLAELEIDEVTMRAQPVWSFGSSDPADPGHFYAHGMGDADMLPDGERVQYVVSAASEDGLGPPHYVDEVGYPGGEPLWRLTCGPMDPMYRVVFFPSLYERSWWYEVVR